LALLSTARVADSAIAAIRFETLGFSDAIFHALIRDEGQ